MINFEISNLESTIENFTRLHETNLLYATAMTVNALAFDIQKSLNDSLQEELNITKKKVGKAFLVKKSRNKYTPVATVYSKRDWHRDVIPHHFTGGVGGVIALEHQQIGKGAMTSQHSIIRGNKVKKLTRALASKLSNTSRYFTIKVGDDSHLHPGIYEKLRGGKIKRIVSFTKLATYTKVLDAQAIASRTIQEKHTQRFRQSLRTALLTSR